MRKKTIKPRFRPQVEVLETRDLPSTFFVAPTGKDANNGSNGAPWLTLQHAADLAQPGDIVMVETGTYKGFDVQTSGTVGAPITFEAAPAANVLITSPETNRGKDGINIEDFNNGSSINYITIQGLTIDNSINGTITEAGIRAVWNGSVNSTGIVINGNTANDCGVWGIFTSHEDNLLIENNTASNSQQQHGIYVSNACFSPVVKGNLLFGNAGAGLHMNGDASQGPAVEPDGTSDGNNGNVIGALVEDNVIYNNGTKGGSGINGDGVQNSTIENNLLYNNHASGISLFQINAALPATNNVVVNNTIVMASDGRWCVNIQNASTGNTVFNNILLNNNPAHGSIAISTDSLTGFVSNDNIVTTNNSAFDQVDSGGNDNFMNFAAWQGPVFPGTGQDKSSTAATAAQLFNAGANNYHLVSGSPAIGKGVASLNGHFAPTIDLDGNPQPTSTGFDIGAYQFPSASPPAPPTNLVANAGNAQVSLTWTASTGATSYDVYRGTTSGGENATPIATNVSGTTFTDAGLTNGTTYFYEVSAVNAGGQSGKSNEASATLIPPAPTNLGATAGNARISLHWTAASGAASYDLYRGTASGGETLVDSNITGTTFTDAGLTNGVAYFYEMSAVNAGGQSGKSNEAAAAPLPRQQTIGAFDPSTGNWYLRNSNNAGGPNISPSSYGAPGWYPVVGDWNGDGLTTIGVVDLATETWYLRDSNSGGGPSYTPFQFGAPGWAPVVGDWNGTGHTGIGAFDPATGNWYLRNEVGAGGADAGQFQFGGGGWKPVVGDWIGQGKTTIGVVNPSTETWYLRNRNSGGGPDFAPFAYGAPGWVPVAGDWNGVGHSGIGVFASSTATWYLRGELSGGGPAAGVFSYGGGNWIPLAGDWDFPALPQLAAGGEARISSGAAPLTSGQLQIEVQAALNLLATDGVSSGLLTRFGTLHFTVGQLPAGYLGLSDVRTGTVEISADAAGYGWFVDANPSRDRPAPNRMDLLTVVLHEMGHFDGWTELDPATYPDALMALTLGTGERRIQALDAVFAAGL